MLCGSIAACATLRRGVLCRDKEESEVLLFSTTKETAGFAGLTLGSEASTATLGR